MKPIIVAVDLGGTRIRAACLNGQLEVLSRAETATLAEQGFAAVLERIERLVHGLLREVDAPPVGIGMAAPGPLNPITGTILSAANLPGAEGAALVDWMHERFGLPAFVNNDANCALLGEAVRGGVRGSRNAIYLTISTGIGSGILVDGRLLLGEQGLAAEAGWMRLVVDGKPYTLEQLAAGPALASAARERLSRGESSIILAQVDGDLSRVDAAVIGAAAHQGDALALQIIRDAGWLLGLGVTTLVYLFNPQTIIFGGGVSNLGALLLEPLQAALQMYSIPPYWENLRFQQSALGDDAGLIGAGVLVLTAGGMVDIADLTQRLDGG